jgi:LAS superfamily LD-carboxypeptidase LdcB
MCGPTAKAMSVLDPEQLTGRSRGHVRELEDLRCTLQPEAAQAFRALRAAAAADGMELAAVSSFRDFERQLTIWNDKFRARRALLDRDGSPLEAAGMTPAERVRAILYWSALPGASRHHWGTEIDVIDRRALSGDGKPQLVPAEYAPEGVFGPLARWLDEHAEGYGFFRPYDRDRGGVQPEPWHLSFAPVAATALPALTVEVLAGALRGVDLAGAEAVWPQLGDIHARYVCAVAAPSAQALAAPRLAPRLNPAATPS